MRWLRAVLTFTGVLVAGFFAFALIGFGVGQVELLILLVVAFAAATAAYRSMRPTA